MEQHGRKVIVIGAGVGGLSTAIALQQAGIAVEVYERRAASPSPDQLARLESLWTRGAVHVYTVTSVDLLELLLKLLPAACRDRLPTTTALVGSERIAAHLRELDVGSPVVVADSSEDASLVEALNRWRIRERG